MMRLLGGAIGSFIAIVCFAIIIECPKKYLPLAGVIGAVGGTVYLFCLNIVKTDAVLAAFSTIIGWGLYGARCIEFIFSAKVIKPFMIVYSLVAMLGATMDLGLVWNIADTFNGLMAIPNLIALFLLSGTVFKLVNEYKEFD